MIGFLLSLILAQYTPSGAPHAVTYSAPTITYVTANCPTCVGTGSTTASATPTTLVIGDLMVVTSKTQSTPSTSTVAFTSSACTFTPVFATAIWHTTNSFSTRIAYCVVATGGSNAVTATWTGGDGTFTDIAIGVYHTTNSWSTLDQSASAIQGTTGSTCPTGTTAATTNANDVVIGISQNFDNAQTWGALAGYTNRVNSSRNTVGWYDKFVTSTGTQTATIPLSVGNNCIGMIVAFKSN